MATVVIPNANIVIPYSEFLDQNTGRPSQAWLQWLMNPNVISQTVNNSIIKGGTIDNVTINNSTIGLTIPAAGKFTDFTALNGVKGGTF
jgi:hypothetical protein